MMGAPDGVAGLLPGEVLENVVECLLFFYLFFFLATSNVVTAFEFAVAETFGLIFFGFLASLLPRSLPLAIRFPF